MKRYPDHDPRHNYQALQLLEAASHDANNGNKEVKEKGDEAGMIDFEFEFCEDQKFKEQEDDQDNEVSIEG